MKRALSLTAKILTLTFAATSILAIAVQDNLRPARAQQPAAFAIGSTPPTELNPGGGGPAQATLQQAAEFAWEEFFALNWPAGQSPSQRDTPSPTCAFGDQSQNCIGPLVWETFRGKVEIFPGNNILPRVTARPLLPMGMTRSAIQLRFSSFGDRVQKSDRPPYAHGMGEFG